MLEGRPLAVEVRRVGPRVAQRGLRLENVGALDDARLVAVAGDRQRPVVGLDGGFQDRLLRLDAADLYKVERQLALGRKRGVDEVGPRCFRFRAGLRDRVADPAP